MAHMATDIDRDARDRCLRARFLCRGTTEEFV